MAQYNRLPLAAEISEVANTQDGRRRFRVRHPVRDIVCVLGEKELRVAKLFDGGRSLSEIRQVLTEQEGVVISMETLAKFEQHLWRAGLLDCSVSGQKSTTQDPFTGMTYDVIHPLIVIKLVSFNPDPFLDKLFSWITFPFARLLALMALTLVTSAATVLFSNWSIYQQAVIGTMRGWNWVMLYLITAFSAVFHEGGHAIACKIFSVRVNQMGLATYFFLLTGWARPNQEEWSNLSKQKKLITILAGPLGSVLYGALGVLLWHLSKEGSLAGIGIIVSIAAFLGVVPTLLPFLNGDGYLALTELFNSPGIRRKSFEYLRNLIQGQLVQQVNAQQRMIYLAVSIGIIIGWIFWWSLMVISIVLIIMREIS